MTKPKPLPRGVNLKTPNAFKVFVSATVYWRAACRLGKYLAVPLDYAMPVFMVEAFSLELHLKCLLRVEGKALTGTHEPRDLYRQLTPDNRKLIRQYAHKSVVEINAALDRYRGVFKNLKYFHEGWKWPRDRQGGHGNRDINQIVHAIRRIVKEQNPGWENRKRLLIG
jgi:hypothetical protein